MGAGSVDTCSAPLHPAQPGRGRRAFGIGREIWIERDDFMLAPSKGYFRLFPGNRVRLKYGHVIECTGCTLAADGRVAEVQALLVPDTKSGTAGADAVKVKGVITWVGAHDGVPAEVRLYERLFTEDQPDAGGRDFKASLNPRSKRVVTAVVDPSLAAAQQEDRVQLERHGYFVADRVDHRSDRPVFNRTATLKDSFPR
jgi:glutaminyl-tRNA synthetase